MTSTRTPFRTDSPGRPLGADAEWEDPRNWRGGWLGIYVAPNDPRLIVRKRYLQHGWTLNFAHRSAWWLFGGGLLLSLLVLLLTIVAEGR